MLYNDVVVNHWPHIQVPTLAFGGAEDSLLGPASAFQERMQFLAKSIPTAMAGDPYCRPRHVPHLEAPEKGGAAASAVLLKGNLPTGSQNR